MYRVNPCITPGPPPCSTALGSIAHLPPYPPTLLPLPTLPHPTLHMNEVLRVSPKVEVCVGARNSACWLSQICFVLCLLVLDTYGPTQSSRHTPAHTRTHTRTAHIAHTASLTCDTNVTRIPATILPANSSAFSSPSNGAACARNHRGNP